MSLVSNAFLRCDPKLRSSKAKVTLTSSGPASHWCLHQQPSRLPAGRRRLPVGLSLSVGMGAVLKGSEHLGEEGGFVSEVAHKGILTCYHPTWL